ncbi:hypothetical protein ACHWQZ_G017599 [Mnemiopsis leidyi]
MLNTRVMKLWQMSKWFVGGGVLSILFYDNIGYVHTVRGRSMSPTLNPGPTRALLRERVWLSKLPYTPHVGDIVVFRSPKHGSKLAMKRIAAVGGETVVPSKVVKSGAAPVTIKPGYVWVEADNRDTAGRDSNEYGQLHEKMIVGKVTWLLWPWARIQDLRKTQPPQTQSLNELKRTELDTEAKAS